MFKIGDRVKVKYHYYERHNKGCKILDIIGNRIKIRDYDGLNKNGFYIVTWVSATDLASFVAGHRNDVLKELGI